MDDQYDIILDSINEGVFTVDTNWCIKSFNRAAEKITGIRRSVAIGRQCCDVFHANICSKSCALRRTFETGKSVENATAHIVKNDGQRVPIRISTAILRNNEGEVVGGVETFQDLSHLEELEKELNDKYTFEDIVGRSAKMRDLFQLLPQIADSNSTVLIEGASGTGKELFARALHNLSARKKQKFVAINCAALPDNLLESELFGYKAGAFTGAVKDKPGRFSIADKGTIFLDEIGDISPALQVRLLRVLQERVVEPVGAVESVPVDVRVVAATNKNLTELVRTGEFREDLFYRIHVIHLELPTLKQRIEDLPILVDHMIQKLNKMQNRSIENISVEAMARLMEHNFPGNIRELENIIEHAFVLCRGAVIELHHLPSIFHQGITDGQKHVGAMSLQSMEKLLITEALKRHHGNRKLTADELGIDTSTLYRKIKNLDVQLPEIDGRHSRQ